MNLLTLAAALTAIAIAVPAHAYEVPPEITPAIRSACEADVRRMCITTKSTPGTVKSCVKRRFGQLNTTCQFRLISAGLVTGQTAKKTTTKKAVTKTPKAALRGPQVSNVDMEKGVFADE